MLILNWNSNLSYKISTNVTLKSQRNRSSYWSFLPYYDVHSNEIERNVGQGLVLSCSGCWLDGAKSECELAVGWKKVLGFKQKKNKKKKKWLDKYVISGRQSYEI